MELQILLFENNYQNFKTKATLRKKLLSAQVIK
jgi:hypothetical protein